MKVARKKKSYSFETLIQLMKNRRGLVILFLTLALPVTHILTKQPQSLRQDASYSTTDTQAPHISLTKPINEATIPHSAPLVLKADATDNIAIRNVEFYVNNERICNDITGKNGYTCGWNIPQTYEKSYTISAKAYDTSGNSSSAIIKIFVE